MTRDSEWVEARIERFETRISNSSGREIMQIVLDVDGVGIVSYWAVRVVQARAFLGDPTFQWGAGQLDRIDQAELTARLAIDQLVEVRLETLRYRGTDRWQIKAVRPLATQEVE